MKPLAAYLEVAPGRTFAGAVDWPGWERSGRDEAAALEAFITAGPRYRRALARVATDLRPPASADEIEVVERHEGGSGTEFGVPSRGPAADDEPVDHADLERLTEILWTVWAAFDRAADEAMGVELRKGPRGGGRDLDRIVRHVLDGERAYLHQLGGRHKALPGEDPGDERPGLRNAAVALLAARARGESVEMGRRTAALWSPRYYVRRSAWHSLDHAWEIEDRTSD